MSSGSLKSFLPLMYPKPLYLELLHFQPSANTLRRLHRSVMQCRNYRDDLEFLLTHSNWRFQLLACAALSAIQPSPALVGPIWAAFDRDSVVGPQLAATAYSCDPDFARHSEDRIRRAILLSPSGDMVTPEETVVGAPTLQLSAKSFFSLVGIMIREGLVTDSLSQRISDFRVQAAWAIDREEEDSEQLATSWLSLAREARLG